MPRVRLAAAVGALLFASCQACEGRPPRPSDEDEELLEDEVAGEVIEEAESSDPNEPPPPAIAELPTSVSSPDARRPPPIVEAHPDREYGSREPVRARRYVYRVRMVVPAGLGEADDRLALPSAELFVDVSHDRLRARFAGAGWPVHAGSEVRLRRDRPGVYVFDGDGGRPLAPGEMAAWFEGGPVTRRGPPLRVLVNYGPARHAPPPPEGEHVPGELVCALLAEWAGEDRETVMRRCERGAPYLWRLGFWRADQTADVPVELPRSSLRADEKGPPATPIVAQRSRAFLEPAALSRIAPSGRTGAVAEGAPGEGLVVRNESATRAIVTVQGIAIGWVDAGATGRFVGFLPGVYEVGSIRPLGAVVQRGRPVAVPGEHRICDGRCRRPEPEGG
ncbi:MAG TPA: hypothetical protein VIL20_16485 [Sandaracinaceae bacterium]